MRSLRSFLVLAAWVLVLFVGCGPPAPRLVPRPDVAVLDHLPEGALRVTDLRVVVGGEEDAAEAAAIDLLKARAGAAGATAIVITSRADTDQDVGTIWPFVRTARYHEFTAIGFRQ